LEILELIFAENPVQVGVAPIRWAPFLKQWSSGGAPSYFSEMIPRLGVQEEAGEPRENECILLRQLKSEKNPEELYSSLLQYLRTQVTKVLRLDLSLQLDPEQSLNELGLDSLTGIELKNRINTELETNVPLEKFFDDASLSKWAKLLVEKVVLENIREKVSSELEPEDNFEEVTL
jgi:aryl carrier-like protein